MSWKSLAVAPLFFVVGGGLSLNLQQYNRNNGMLLWEGNSLAALVNQFDGNQATVNPKLVANQNIPQNNVNAFVNRFIACSKTEAIEYIPAVPDDPMRAFLTEVAHNPIGRETMYRIMAKLEPRIGCVNSIEGITRHIHDNNNQLVSKLTVCANFLVNDLHLVQDTDSNAFFQDFLALAMQNTKDVALQQAFEGFLNTPAQCNVNDNNLVFTDGANLTVTQGRENDVTALIDAIVAKLDFCSNALRSSITRLRFRLVFNPTAPLGDYYDLTDNMVSITGQESRGNLVTGPVWRDRFTSVAIETRWDVLRVPSTLKHELGHYLRVGLEGINRDEAFLLVAPSLFNQGVSNNYLMHLRDIWDDTEELTEIFGIIYVNGNVYYDYLNQSEFNLGAGGSARYSHKNSRFHSVPYHLFNIFRRQGALPIVVRDEVYYDSAIANVLY
jgi:hypothetical protein